MHKLFLIILKIILTNPLLGSNFPSPPLLPYYFILKINTSDEYIDVDELEG